MNWSDHLTRLRRWVRDPNGDIFTEAFLLRLFNDELQQFYGILGPVSDVLMVKLPPEFQHGYTHDFEWAYTDHAAGEVYQVGGYYDALDYVFLHVWEPEHLKGYDATTTGVGDVYTQPWEAWTCTPHFPPPIELPDNFESAIYLAHDRDRIDPITKKEILGSGDTAWKTQSGSPYNYWRDEKNSKQIYIYPLPSILWQDDEFATGYPDTAEYATVDEGVTFGGDNLYFGSSLITFGSDDDSITTDNNLLVIYRIEPAEITGSDDETELPEWMQKYVEYGTASRALRANTDGRIESLADYWDVRKRAGYEAVNKWKRLKMSDREIQFRSSGSRGEGQRPKYPRLPSTYPDGWA